MRYDRQTLAAHVQLDIRLYEMDCDRLLSYNLKILSHTTALNVPKLPHK